MTLLEHATIQAMAAMIQIKGSLYKLSPDLIAHAAFEHAIYMVKLLENKSAAIAGTRVRLVLKDDYTTPEGKLIPNSRYNFVNTTIMIERGKTYTFDDLAPYSIAGDLTEKHYHYFEGVRFKAQISSTSVCQFDLIEV